MSKTVKWIIGIAVLAVLTMIVCSMIKKRKSNQIEETSFAEEETTVERVPVANEIVQVSQPTAQRLKSALN